ncbi:SH3 domain-containing protein [Marinomonas mediterranea]|jgi:Variant SH3 domain.|uniref:Variant SH3 domain-containing protein n=1 Tax=Marinomonas mediterranea (strain ATCC 700492 / JCM 21426 / NBRC 103028 / MMB-1) TaxID=717774 RepID=F2JY69_MARM1|nr:SH3 domain-containing protein [Marinomonas mediterranea]ADZ90805.1 Variant SH3 domain-containing protein [Marinomonas mediterranea MMB-1]WCN08845.1 hypothetical protein GV055_07810 [Marinomonas mediterranea]WCN12890.1 hypothetical protein GV054_07600 [Marinomonas mediterranea]WCN16958.1 hypothetical protein GV053_07745 [Marinomonas mediterranea MMB-1]
MKVKAINSHISNYPNPIEFQPGDKLILGELDAEFEGWIRVETEDKNRGWAPVQYIEPTSRGLIGYAKCDYNACELNIDRGDVLVVLKELNQWYYVQNEEGRFGWVPVQCTSLLEEAH